MKLYAAKVETIANEVIGKLVADGDLEVSDGHEAQLDVASVLKEYLKVDKELNDRTKYIMEIRGLPHSAFGRTKRTLADQKAFGLGEEGLTWICNQIVELFMRSPHVEAYA